jgi:aspartate/methionine/tyrosine aminotransferase
MAKAAVRSAIPPFIVMDVLRAANERAAAGENIVHLEVGQPATPAPAAVLDAARHALASERLGYTDALGLPALRQRIARFYDDRYGVALDWRRVVITTGSSGAFVLSFLAALDAGAALAVAVPGYPAYRHIAHALGIRVVTLRCDAASHFQPTAAMLEACALDPCAGPLAALIVASPANPTGAMLSRAALAELAGYAADRGLIFISDEIYHGITFDVPATTALAVSDEAIVINSFSKYFSMTGWRLGWLVLPEGLLRAAECLAQNLYLSPPTLSQHAALAAFDCDAALRANVERYRRNRALLLAALPSLGFTSAAPADGAFYIYADIGDLAADSRVLATRLLAEAGVAVTPGVDFDPAEGDRAVRLSYAGETAEIAEAIRRLSHWRERTG